MPVTPRRRAQFLPPGRVKGGEEFSDNTGSAGVGSKRAKLRESRFP
jgi:hypothetical protein